MNITKIITRINVKRLVHWLLIAQVFFSAIVLFYLLLWQGPVIIGEGKFNSILHIIETTDYRWWMVLAAGLYFFSLLSMFILFVVADISRWQLEEIKKHFYTLIKDKHIPVTVDIHEEIPVHLDRPVSAPFSINTNINFDQSVAVRATIPVKLSLPIDTIVETSVLGLGKIKIPIKTSLPIDINFPFDGNVHMRVDNFNFALNEMAQVQLPPISVPIHCQVKAQLNIESNIQQVEELIRRKRE